MRKREKETGKAQIFVGRELLVVRNSLKCVRYREVAWCRRFKDLCRRLAKSDDTNDFWRHVDRAHLNSM